MAADGDNIVWFSYTGHEDIPDEATHIFVAVTVIRAQTFYGHPNIVEVICHENVEKIEEYAFYNCDSLRRVIMPGVTILEHCAFYECNSLTDVECGKLEIIGKGAFSECESLGSIDLSSARIVERNAFGCCRALMDLKFGIKLERIDEMAFSNCTSLAHITIPLKNDLITHDDTFLQCENLNRVDLVEGEILRETITALQLEEWRNDMHDEIDTINQILPTTDAGERWYDDVGEKAQTIRSWMRSVLGKIIHYKAHHQRIMDEASTTLQLSLSQDVLANHVLPFLELPSHTFELEDHEDEEDESDDEEE